MKIKKKIEKELKNLLWKSFDYCAVEKMLKGYSDNVTIDTSRWIGRVFIYVDSYEFVLELADNWIVAVW